MTIAIPEPNSGWHSEGGEPPVRLFVSREDCVTGEWAGRTAAEFPVELLLVPSHAPIGPEHFVGAAAAVVEVIEGDEASIERFATLAEGETPMIATAYNPSLAFVRALVRLGAHDVVPMPVELVELESALDPIRRSRARDTGHRQSGNSRLIVAIKSEGGVGATAILSQLATRFATEEAQAGRETCLIDLDLQFGDVAFQLGLQPPLSLADLIAAGSRVDGALVRATTARHPSGLHIVAAPREILPLNALNSDALLHMIDVARTEFSTLFVDLPSNWTDWSLSLLARADLILMVSQLNIASLNRARRQLELLQSQGLGNIELRLLLNRFEKKMFTRLTPADVERVLGRSADYTMANDYEAMTEAIERGVPLAEVRRKGALAKDLKALDAGIAAVLGRER